MGHFRIRFHLLTKTCVNVCVFHVTGEKEGRRDKKVEDGLCKSPGNQQQAGRKGKNWFRCHWMQIRLIDGIDLDKSLQFIC